MGSHVAAEMPTPLEPDGAALGAMGRTVLDLLAGFVDGLPRAPAVDLDDRPELVAASLRPPAEDPGQLDALLAHVREAAALAVDTAGPRYMAYVPGGGLVTAALGELLAMTLNRYAGIAAFAPALVALEEGTLRWLSHEFGQLPRPGGRAGGIVTTGGSLATLTAIVAARHDRLGERFDDGTLYVTAHTHRCVAKAARIAGFPADAVRIVPTTPDLRMDPRAAGEMVAADRRAGRRPFLLVGTGGTTSTGTVDPLDELAALAHREDLWFHVDGAYGGCFQLTERGRARLSGIEQADSIVLDPHKGFFLPYGTGVLLVRDTGTLGAAYAADGHYLQDARTTDDDAGPLLPDYADLGLELSRELRALRLWLPLHLHGVGAFRRALDEKLDLAAEAYEALGAEPALELPWPPDLSTVVFRLRPQPGWTTAQLDAANAQLLQQINATRRIHLSSTQVDGRHTLRLCVLSHRTHQPHVAEAVDLIRTTARELVATTR
jgi:aromatic-L-amino-acid/L-tryptophan decarboxylase